MTREEALNFFQKAKDAIEIRSENGMRFHVMTFTDGTKEAIDMAIEALQGDTVATIQTGQTYGKSAYIKELAEVVRCKDCRYFKKIAERSDSGLCHRDIVASAWKENGYCSRGERKGGDDE